MKRVLAIAAAVILALVLFPKGADAHKDVQTGAWYVDTCGAPFAPHAMSFLDAGVVLLTNPDAAEAQNSSSVGMGSWWDSRGDVAGKFIEVNASKSTNTFTSNLIVTFTIDVRGDRFDGPAEASYYGADGKLIEGPYPATLRGQRIDRNSRPPVLSDCR